ncbi:MAG TPA: hypothetical protein VJN42_00590 [Candidatus Acidoferrum sp.]|nr:hypothetical protein [Candidatus Acidoferrum sp.]
MLKNSLRFLVFASLFLFVAFADSEVISAIRGTITKIDAASKTISVKAVDGTEHTFHFVSSTAVHGAHATAAGATDAFHGLTEGSEVVGHYTVKGSEEIAVEVDNLGKDGLHSVDGTVSKVSADGKTVVVKAADGTEQAFHVVGRDTAASAKQIGSAADTSAKYTVYYTQTAGKKIAHFFQKL